MDADQRRDLSADCADSADEEGAEEGTAREMPANAPLVFT